MPKDLKTLSIGKLAKYGYFEELCRRAAAVENLDLAHVFDRAVTDFRTVKRKPGHQRILQWCIDQGLDFDARAGWLNQSVVCLAAAYGNNEIIESMMGKGLPDNPFARASVGDLEFLEGHASQHGLSDLKDENGFNLLFYCAGSGLGRRDEDMKRRLAEVCRLLLDHGVSPSHEVESELPVFPAFLCAASGGNEEVMRLLLDHGGAEARTVPSNIGAFAGAAPAKWRALLPHCRTHSPTWIQFERHVESRPNPSAWFSQSRDAQGRAVAADERCRHKRIGRRRANAAPCLRRKEHVHIGAQAVD